MGWLVFLSVARDARAFLSSIALEQTTVHHRTFPDDAGRAGNMPSASLHERLLHIQTAMRVRS
jgi:hypothetical protein